MRIHNCEPLISIIVPAYDAAAYLAQTLSSVLRQTIDDWEVVVVDDGSSDATADVASRFRSRDPRFKLVRHPNCGVSKSRNIGYLNASSSSKFVMFLDSDDCLLPDAIERLLSKVTEVKTAAGAHGTARFINELGVHVRQGAAEKHIRARRYASGVFLKRRALDLPTILPVLLFQNIIYTPGQVLLKREVVEDVGLFSTELSSLCEDYEYFLRVLFHSPIAFIDQVVVDYRTHDKGASRKLENMFDAMLAVRAGFICERQLDVDLMAQYSNALPYIYACELCMHVKLALRNTVIGSALVASLHAKAALHVLEAAKASFLCRK